MPARYSLLRKAKGKRALPLLNGRRLDQTEEEEVEVEEAQDQVACGKDHRCVCMLQKPERNPRKASQNCEILDNLAQAQVVCFKKVGWQALRALADDSPYSPDLTPFLSLCYRCCMY